MSCAPKRHTPRVSFQLRYSWKSLILVNKVDKFLYLVLICVYVLDVWVVQQVAQTALSQCSCRSARADYIDAVFGYRPAHLPPTFHQRQETPAQPCLPLRPSPPAFMHVGGGGQGCPACRAQQNFSPLLRCRGWSFPPAVLSADAAQLWPRGAPRSGVTNACVRPVMWGFRRQSATAAHGRPL